MRSGLPYYLLLPIELLVMTFVLSFSASAEVKCFHFTHKGNCNPAPYNYYACGESYSIASNVGQQCSKAVDNILVDGTAVTPALGGSVSVEVLPANTVAPPTQDTLQKVVRGSCSCQESCPTGMFRWSSNNRCYKCPEGEIYLDDGAGNAGCKPRCEGLSGAALAECQQCNVSGGVACRCDQLTGMERELCFCSAFGGGDACFKCPASAPYKWSNRSCNACPEARPYKWSTGRCDACPETLRFKWANGVCNRCPESKPYDDGKGGCSQCPPNKPLLKNGVCTV